MEMADLQAAIVAKRAERGFVTDPVKLCVLLSEEVGELAQLFKRTWSPNYDTPARSEFAEECSDVFVILAAIAQAYDIDLEAAVAEKFFEKDELRDWATRQKESYSNPGRKNAR